MNVLKWCIRRINGIIHVITERYRIIILSGCVYDISQCTCENLKWVRRRFSAGWRKINVTPPPPPLSLLSLILTLDRGEQASLKWFAGLNLNLESSLKLYHKSERSEEPEGARRSVEVHRGCAPSEKSRRPPPPPCALPIAQYGFLV